MAEFKSLAEIQKYMEQNMETILRNSMQLESYLAQKMSDAVIEHVYSVYTPESYERRGLDGGLADPRNMAITSVDIVGSSVKISFENLTEGNDSLAGDYISGLIEHGEGFNGMHWDNASGAWAKSRPFAAKTAENIIANPGTLIKLLKGELFNAGFKVD